MFSVIIPVHNKLPHLDRSINSVLNQRFSNFELIIVDDNSDDGSSEKLLSFDDERIRVLRRDTPGPGGYAARNLGVEAAKCEWIAFLDADDEWSPDYLLNLSNAIQEIDGVEVISSRWNYSNSGNLIGVPFFETIRTKYFVYTLTDYFNNNLIVWTSAVAIKRKLLLRAGLFPAGKCKRGGDMDTWIRVLTLSRRNIFINKLSAIYYRDTVNRVTDNEKNPSDVFCWQESIQAIRNTTNDKKLLKAIDKYCSKFVLIWMIKKLRSGGTINHEKLSVISSTIRRNLVLNKVRLYNLQLYFTGRHSKCNKSSNN